LRLLVVTNLTNFVGKLLQQERVAWLAVHCKAVVLWCVVLCCVEFPLSYWNMCCVPAHCELMEHVL